MDRDTVIKICRYYGGEEECPEALKKLPAGESLWFYESGMMEFGGARFRRWY